MELGDGDPEGWSRKGGEVSSKQEKSRLSSPHSPSRGTWGQSNPDSCSPFFVAALVPFPTWPSVSFHSLKQQSESFSVLNAGLFTKQFHMHHLL